MIDDKDGHVTSTLLKFTCTALHYALPQWQKNKGIHPIPSKSMLNADRPDRLNHFTHKNDGGQIGSCSTVKGRKLLTSPVVANMYTFLMNTWNTLPESCQQRVYNNTVATVKRQIHQAENPTLAVVISMEHQQNVTLFGSHNSTTLLFRTATPILPEAPRRSRTG